MPINFRLVLSFEWPFLKSSEETSPQMGEVKVHVTLYYLLTVMVGGLVGSNYLIIKTLFTSLILVALHPASNINIQVAISELYYLDLGEEPIGIN